MSKFKKFVAGVLAAAVCVTSFAAPAPKDAEAATYCSHTIYRAGKECVDSIPGKHQYIWEVTVPDFMYMPPRMVTYRVPATCNVLLNVYQEVYRCYKCDYHYYGGSTSYEIVHLDCVK